MSEVYVSEPPLRGKVILNTTHGDLDVELWSKECPKACRNFIQLCLEGYYDDVIFHRIISEFIVQTGDPTGTGRGGESIYGKTSFPNEIHSRLKFRYRGLMGVASLNESEASNGSQFFITLGRADYLNGKNTLFGKVTGETIYNLLSISEVDVDEEDRPHNPPRILSTEVLWNPFDDIVVREKKPVDIKCNKNEVEEEPIKRVALSSRKMNLLSFNSENEEEEDMIETRGVKSAHDLLEDPRLLKEESSTYITHPLNREDKVLKSRLEEKEIDEDEGFDGYNRRLMDETEEEVSMKLPSDSKNNEGGRRAVHEKHESSRQHSGPAALTLKKGVGYMERLAAEKEAMQDADLMSEKEKRYQLTLQKKRNVNKRQRESNAYQKLLEFNKKLKQQTGDIKTTTEDPSLNEEAPSGLPNFDEEIDESDGTWLKGKGLKFSVDSARAYELDAAKDSLAVSDPLSQVDAEKAMKLRRNQRLKPTSGRKEVAIKW